VEIYEVATAGINLRRLTIPIGSLERMLQDIFCNRSTRCLSVITRRAEVNVAKHPGIDDLSKRG
jgi:hypothetical protein